MVRDDMLLIKMTETEKARLRVLAERHEVSMSQMVRQLIKQAAENSMR